jgi:hypothetical protein
MKKKYGIKRNLFRSLQTPITILLLDLVLHRIAAHTHAVASVFAAGPHVPKNMLLIAVVFLALHFTVVALIPGFVAARIAGAILKSRQR